MFWFPRILDVAFVSLYARILNAAGSNRRFGPRMYSAEDTSAPDQPTRFMAPYVLASTALALVAQYVTDFTLELLKKVQ